MVPPVPVLFSTTTDCLSSSDRGCSMMLVTMSVPPPGPKTTSTRIGRSFGHSAAAGAAIASITPAAKATLAAAIKIRCMSASPFYLRFFVFDRIAQSADALNLDLDRVASFHPYRLRFARMADARRRSCEQNVAGLERHALGQVDQRL